MWGRMQSYYATKMVNEIEFKRGGDSDSCRPMSVLRNTQTNTITPATVLVAGKSAN